MWIDLGKRPMTGRLDQHGFTGREAADVVGITYRQLDYWANTDLIRPSLADARGSGTRRRYSYRDVINLAVVKALLDAGQRLERCRLAFALVRDLDDLHELYLVVVGHAVTVARTGEELMAAVRHHSSDVVAVLALDGILEHIDGQVAALRGDRP